jgi:putative membrane protein
MLAALQLSDAGWARGWNSAKRPTFRPWVIFPRRDFIMIRYVLIACAATALTACGQQTTATTEPDAPPPAAAPAVNAMSAADFVQTVANSDAFEIQSSGLASSRAARQEVKDFAATMVRDHTLTTQQLTALAPQINLSAPTPQLDAAKQGQIEALRGQTGAAFDDAYLDAQVAAHTEAVRLFEEFAANGEPGPLRDWANTTLPKLREHLTHVQGLENAT